MLGMGRFQGAGRSRTKPHMIHTTKHSHQPRRALDTRPPECRRALHGAAFLRGAGTLPQGPTDAGREVAFAGRSNAGKSSAINAIAGNRKLARTSKTPGCTRQLNFFSVGDGRRLVDLPGYGYARVAVPLQHLWQVTVTRYLRERRSLSGLVLICDCRRRLDDVEIDLIAACRVRQVPVRVLLSKADKLSRSQAGARLEDARDVLRRHRGEVGVQLFSARGGLGVDQAAVVIAGWLWPSSAEATAEP